MRKFFFWVSKYITDVHFFPLVTLLFAFMGVLALALAAQPNLAEIERDLRALRSDLTAVDQNPQHDDYDSDSFLQTHATQKYGYGRRKPKDSVCEVPKSNAASVKPAFFFCLLLPIDCIYFFYIY